MCKNAVKKLLFVMRYVPDQYKTQEMRDKVILKNGGILIFVPDCYNKKCVIKLLIIMLMHYAHEFVHDCYKTQKMCNKTVDSYPSAVQFITDNSKIVLYAVGTYPFVFDSVTWISMKVSTTY